GNIRKIGEIERPSRHAAGVNRVLETIARSFEGTGAALERELTTDSLGDILLVRCDSTRNEPGILVLSHMDTVHPVGTLASKLTCRREGDRVIPTLDGLGVDGDGAHTNHEYMLFSSIEPRTRLLQGLMEQLE